MKHEEIKINDKGYVFFGSRNWAYAGDRMTFVKQNKDNSFTVKRAAKGIISDTYNKELKEFCLLFNFDFSNLKSGEEVTLNK